MGYLRSRPLGKKTSRKSRTWVHQIVVWLLIVGILMISFSSASPLPELSMVTQFRQ
jgi:hypothetical protein